MSERGFLQPTCFEPSLFESNQLQSFTPNASVCQTAEKETDLGARPGHLTSSSGAGVRPGQHLCHRERTPPGSRDEKGIH